MYEFKNVTSIAVTPIYDAAGKVQIATEYTIVCEPPAKETK